MNIFYNFWKHRLQMKAEIEAFDTVWKDNRERIHDIEKQQSWAYGFLVGVVFTALFLLILNYFLIN